MIYLSLPLSLVSSALILAWANGGPRWCLAAGIWALAVFLLVHIEDSRKQAKR